MIAMGKSILGVDIGYNSLKLALFKDGELKETLVGVQEPQDVVEMVKRLNG